MRLRPGFGICECDYLNVKLIERTDSDGTKHLVWLRDVDLDDAGGIPHDPPDLSPLGLPDRVQRTLNNILIGKRLITWQNHDQLTQGLTGALQKIRRLDLLADLITLYDDRQVANSYRAEFDLNHVLGGLDITPDQRACVKRMFRQANITNLDQVENAPGIFRGHVCGVDIYQLVNHILSRVIGG